MIECLYCGWSLADAEFAAAEQDTVFLVPCSCGERGLEELAERVVYWPETGMYTVS